MLRIDANRHARVGGMRKYAILTVDVDDARVSSLSRSSDRGIKSMSMCICMGQLLQHPSLDFTTNSGWWSAIHHLLTGEITDLMSKREKYDADSSHQLKSFFKFLQCVLGQGMRLGASSMLM